MAVCSYVQAAGCCLVSRRAEMVAQSPVDTLTVGEGGSFPLGIYTKLDSAYSLSIRARRWVELIETGEAKQIRFAQLAFLRSKLPETFRTKKCLAQVQYGRDDVSLLYNEKHHSHFHGAAVCGSVWTCPVCAERITAIRRQELKKLLVQTKYKICMVTYTLEHHQGEPLAEMVNDLNKALRAAKTHRPWRRLAEKWGIIGSVFSLEVTYGENGFHPHRHEMLVLDNAQLAGAKGKELLEGDLQREIFAIYQAELHKNGRDCDQEHGVIVSANRKTYGDYIAKWGVTEELTRSTMKKASGEGKHKSVWELLTDAVYGDALAWEHFLEYAAAFKGKKQLHWSQGLRELLGLGEEIDDQKAAETIQLPQDRVILLLSRSAWHYLIYQDLLGPALKFSDLCGGDADQVRDFLARMGCRRGVVIPDPACDIWEGANDG